MNIPPQKHSNIIQYQHNKNVFAACPYASPEEKTSFITLIIHKHMAPSGRIKKMAFLSGLHLSIP
jgi:hypothetical protein